jgi:O-antigen biosynthesis protein
VLLAHGDLSRLQRGLAALRRTLPARLAQMVVIADQVPDDALVWLRAQHDLSVLTPTDDLPLISTCNQVVAAALGEYVVILDSRLEPAPGWLDQLLSAADSNPSAAAVGARLITPDGRLLNAGYLLDVAGNLAGRGEGAHANTHSYLPPANVDVVQWPCMLIRKPAFVQVEGMDPRSTSLDQASADLCLRFWQAGYQVTVEPSACVIQAHDTSPKLHLVHAEAQPPRGRVAAEKPWEVDAAPQQLIPGPRCAPRCCRAPFELPFLCPTTSQPACGARR